MISEVETLLKERFKEITVRDGKVHSYLGMTFDFSNEFEVKITMENYTSELL
jgi:hypothetical protein